MYTGIYVLHRAQKPHQGVTWPAAPDRLRYYQKWKDPVASRLSPICPEEPRKSVKAATGTGVIHRPCIYLIVTLAGYTYNTLLYLSSYHISHITLCTLPHLVLYCTVSYLPCSVILYLTVLYLPYSIILTLHNHIGYTLYPTVFSNTAQIANSQCPPTTLA